MTKAEMLTFRCTQKARDLLRLSDRDLSDEAQEDFAEWFVDVATIERHRCLLFTHKVTLYSFWAAAVRKPDLLRFDELFRHHAIATLTADGFQTTEIERLLPMRGHQFAKTNSRPVTGSMNDHVQNSRWYIEQDGGLKVADVGALKSPAEPDPHGGTGSRTAHGLSDRCSHSDYSPVGLGVIGHWAAHTRKSHRLRHDSGTPMGAWPSPVRLLPSCRHPCRADPIHPGRRDDIPAPALRAAGVPSPCSAAPIASSRTVTNRLRLPSHHRGLTGQGRVSLGFSGFGLLSFDSRRLHKKLMILPKASVSGPG
jgi:hypothetical protein